MFGCHRGCSVQPPFEKSKLPALLNIHVIIKCQTVTFSILKKEKLLP